MITFAEARIFVMPIGPSQGKILDKIAESDEGLAYLYLLHHKSLLDDDSELQKHLEVYLSDKSIAKDCRNVMNRKRSASVVRQAEDLIRRTVCRSQMNPVTLTESSTS